MWSVGDILRDEKEGKGRVSGWREGIRERETVRVK